MFVPNWQVPNQVKSLQTTRQGGFSRAPYDSLNLGNHVGDSEHVVSQNRRLIKAPQPIQWLEQVHGDTIHELTPNSFSIQPVVADAVYTREKQLVCAVMTADCLPILITDKQASFVAAIHCGWRGLQQRLISKSLAVINPDNLSNVQVWLGPAIGEFAFEVGEEVKSAFTQISTEYESAFFAKDDSKFLANIYLLAQIELNKLGVQQISSDFECTFSQTEKYFSYRRETVTGRQASLIWIE